VHDERGHAGGFGRLGHSRQAAGAGDRGDHIRVGVLVGEFAGSQLTGGRYRADAHGERRGVRLQRRDGVLTDDRDALRGFRGGGQQRSGGAVEIGGHLGPRPGPGIVCECHVLRRGLGPSTNRGGHESSFGREKSGLVYRRSKVLSESRNSSAGRSD
jgi:hypothetical protein